MNDKYVITVNRQFGSLGRPIAARAAELLNIEYYDRDIVDETAKSRSLPVSVISNEEESAKTAFFRMKYPLGLGTSKVQDEIFYIQKKIISEIAEKKTCIIVGRCSDYILANIKNSVHIYIYAPYEDRLRNCTDNLKMEYDEARKMIAEVDKARASYHKHYTGYFPDDPDHMDLIINSSLLGVEGTAYLIKTIAERKFNIS